jgi:hypothetical protein
MTTDRSKLQVRAQVDPARKGEYVFAVLRDGEVVATIYGSREGLRIVSERFTENQRNKPFFFEAVELPPGYVIPLLKQDEQCPWCAGSGMVHIGEGPEVRICPVCSTQ